MRRLIPDTIAARTLLVLLAGLAVSHILSVALYFNDRTSALMFTSGTQTAERIATLKQLVEKAPQTERQRITEHADQSRLHVTLSQENAINGPPAKDRQADEFRDTLVAHLDNGDESVLRTRYTGGDATGAWRTHMRENHQGEELGRALAVSFQLRDGSWLNFAAPVATPPPLWSLRFTLSMGIMLLGVVIFSTLVVHHLTRPLETFARAAHRLGTDVRAPPLPESGPAEVRQATRAFNEMQDRIRRFVEDRTQMLAAISHDLGTPITRLRLRAEFIEDEDQQKKMLADLDDMEKMVSSSLSFARDEATSEPHAMVDLRSLLQRVCDDMADSGHEVTLDIGGDAVPFDCRSVALRRALSNLVGNAVKYGHRARVSLAEEGDAIVVAIDDDGPGIPGDRREDVFKPFLRLEVSRSRKTGGTGLGLTVARTIVRAHGGHIALGNRKGGGLRVKVTLPR